VALILISDPGFFINTKVEYLNVCLKVQGDIIFFSVIIVGFFVLIFTNISCVINWIGNNFFFGSLQGLAVSYIGTGKEPLHILVTVLYMYCAVSCITCSMFNRL
jgi:hypothetical protein